jgi:NAD(P)-dependent dehydrogenase (short-subunit alcohol dehydrogenase family)
MPASALELFRLDGRVALVTGGAGIVGKHISSGLAEAGATVVIASRDLAHGQVYARELQSRGLSIEAEACDFSVEESISELRERLLSRYGRLDILINNAVARAGKDLDETTADEWDTVMRLNSTGLFLTCKILAELMKADGRGSIVNISSIYGMVGPDFSIYEGTPVHNSASYSFAKGGMINFTRYLASYLAPSGIRVNCLSPGGFQTENTPARFVENYSRRTLLGRMATGEDIQGAAIFLASDASRYITGQNIAVDGGWTAI